MAGVGSSSHADRELAQLYSRHIDMVYRLCYVYLKNTADLEDAASTVFLKLVKSGQVFHDQEHEKAWLICATRNTCKDILKHWWRTRRVDLRDLPEVPAWDDQGLAGTVLAALLALPEKYKSVLYLYYYEGYSVREMSVILGRNQSTLQTQLAKGRQLLRINLEGDFND